MTPERLAAIRQRTPSIPVITPEQDAAELLAEVDRLRTGIEALAETWEHAVDDLNPLSSLGRALLMYGPDELRALLNPEETS